MTFEESVKYLLSLGNEVLAMKLGLENITRLLQAIGDPQKNYYKVQVAGTNGKGSTCAFLEAICLSAGIKVGMTTSPHLISITERIRINNTEIDEESFARYASKIRETSESLVAAGRLESVPTYFEQVTAIALHAFSEAGVELAILETGLGGRFDATTAARAEIAVITPVDYDHQAILGHTLTEIAGEKAAIIRPDSKVISAHQVAEAADVIEKVCFERGVSLPANFTYEGVGYDERGRFSVNFRTPGGRYGNVTLGLSGWHQIENAGTSILTAESLKGKFAISDTDIVRGLTNAVHKGRLEFRDNYLFDGAHNIAGADALAQFLDDFIDRPVTMIFGAMRDKDLQRITRRLFPRARVIIFTRAENPRSVEPPELSKFSTSGYPPKFETETVLDALRIAQEETPPNGIICVTGSLYLVGEAMKLLNNREKL